MVIEGITELECRDADQVHDIEQEAQCDFRSQEIPLPSRLAVLIGVDPIWRGPVTNGTPRPYHIAIESGLLKNLKSGGIKKALAKGGARAALHRMARAFSVLIESEPKLWILVLTRFLHANRCPLRSKTL